MAIHHPNGKTKTIRTESEFKKFWGNGKLRSHIKYGEFVKNYNQDEKLLEFYNIKENSLTKFGKIDYEDDMASGTQSFQD